ncbi:tryptophan 2,3-dioxygenase [Fibrella aestuarina BUZ 2]|uniref:Tryptophan 2,3-dioxygenase n=1 Tax=Fibrella aestuarina BUZ 2 TaxID=1166018 RepID=I0KED8_9BACT|nr:tryptophan 2,3-dioxygenase family protein [Fibrella aestuarina]CCH02491.1 tryptophan 2,3-dioxygenase [Fibrella aestuarina BUZ 2]
MHTTSSTDSSDKLKRLEQKYAAMGQDMASYLDGLLQADYLTYWDYVHLDTLLSLQQPRTAYPDELIFITYHQITELYFKLILHEVRQIIDHPALTPDFFEQRMVRVNRYFDILERSFAIMIEGMDREQFLKFRMALLPSSGFQSVQFRQIEILSTDFANLLAPNHPLPPNAPIAEQYDWLYWKQGATELATNQKTLTLRQFEQQYGDTLIRLAQNAQTRNLWQCYQRLEAAGQPPENLIAQLRDYDDRVNVRWKLAHLRAAVTYLHKEPEQIKATGGTNWQTYLPPVQQQRRFFPHLWTEAEQQQWGKR